MQPARIATLIGGLLIALALPATASAAGRIAVSEIAVAHNAENPLNDEFLELVNIGDASIDISGYVVTTLSVTCTNIVSTTTVPAGVTLAPNQHYLFAGQGYTYPVAGDQQIEGGITLDAVENVGVVRVHNASASLIDVVGYGDPAPNPDCFEGGMAAQAPIPPGSIERKQGGTQDNDNNLDDFQQRPVPDPQNRALTAPPEPTPTPTPSPSPSPSPTPTPTPTPAPTQTPVPQPLGPNITTIRTSVAQPHVGQTFDLIVGAQLDGFVTAGYRIDFDEAKSTVSASGCQLKPFSPEFKLGQSTTFRIPFEFKTPGIHNVTVIITASAGGCGEPHGTTTQTFRIEVLPRAGSHSAAHLITIAAQAAHKTRCKGATTPITKATLRAARTTLLCMTNEVRRGKRRRPLKANRLLTKSATAHARDMVKRRYFAHEGPNGPALLKRLKKAGYRGRRAGENIAFSGAPTPEQLIGLWVKSPPHYANMIFPRFRFMGSGIVMGAPVPGESSGGTFVVNFGGTKR